jgi:hypothetical protein
MGTEVKADGISRSNSNIMKLIQGELSSQVCKNLY